MPHHQAGGLLSVATPLGTDAFHLLAMRGAEAMSSLFEFELDLLTDKKDVDPGQLIGRSVAFAVTPKAGAPRTFNGFARRLVYVGLAAGGHHHWRVHLVPWLWFLSKRADFRIFQNKTVIEIVESVFRDAGFDAFETSGITGSYPAYEYCVQLGESDLDFVMRLLEDEGIFFFFRFDPDRHVLVLGDNKAVYADCAEPEIEFTSAEPSHLQVSGWEHRFDYVSGKWALCDYDFTHPTTSLFTDIDTVLTLPNAAAFVRYEYPGRYVARGHGESKAKARMEAEESGHDVVDGAGACHSFAVGTKFKLAHRHHDADDGKSFVTTAVEHSAQEGGYRNRFTCIPDSVLYRPPQKTPKPRAPGPQTAFVVGPSGEEIHTDEYGRVKVQFHWDRKGANDDKSSCWMRVAQSMAGKRFGAQVLPRVGQEVIVEFIDGDPDRPIVTGAVYNANTMPAYELPANKTQSGIRSKSTKDGANDALNEIRFEDKKGSEHIYVHAQKDQHHHVVNDHLVEIGNDEHRTIGRDSKNKVTGEFHLTIDGDRIEKLGGNHSEELVGDRKSKLGGDLHEKVGGKSCTEIGADQELDVGGAQKLKVGGDQHMSAGKNANLKAGMNLAFEGGMNVHLKGGMNVVIEAGMQLTLKAGGSFVVIGAAGVDISGAMVKINSGGAAGAGDGCSPQAPGTATAPDAPEAPTKPMAIVAAAAAAAGSTTTAAQTAASLQWTTIETAPPTAQSSALQSASDSGDAFCEVCNS